jgi:hypothetical protein
MSSESPETSSAPPDNSRASEPTQNRATDPVALSSPLVKPIRDVWFYTAPRYRVRASVLLAINLVLYAGLCVFTHWLHTAEPFTFDINSYTQPARFWGEQTVGLNNFLLYPINVTRTPWHGIVLGLLMAAIVATPIAVAILYRFPAVFPFAACVLVLAHMPWMSFTLVCSAVLAALPPFRLKFRFGSALVALIPIMVHMYLSTLSTVEQVSIYAAPELRLQLTFPWLLAIVAAAIMLGLILLIASLVRYRPGAVTPVLAAVLVPPLLVFHTQVGADELDYRVLERQFGPKSQAFSPVLDARREILDLVHQYDPGMDEMFFVWTHGFESLHRRVIERFETRLYDARAAANQACAQFIADYPQSRFVPSVKFIQARALDMRLDTHALRHRASREIYSDFPHPQSEPHWATLWTAHTDSPLALAAAVRLAELAMRRGDVSDALERLEVVLERNWQFNQMPERAAATSIEDFLAPEPAETSLGFEVDPLLSEARRMHELITQNADDPKFGSAPLQDFFRLDPRRPKYAEQIRRMMDQYPLSHLGDNLAVRWAMSAPSPVDRVLRFDMMLLSYPKGDAAAEAHFRLADIQLQTRGQSDPAARRRGIAEMQNVTEQYGNTIWGDLARQRLELLSPTQSNLPDAE